MGWGWSAVALAVVILAVSGCRFPAGWLYVTRVTSTAATVVWTGDGDAVRCSAGGGPVLAVPGAPARRGLRVARLGGLAPRTVYRCRIGTLAARRRLRFRTAPGDTEPIVFAAVGDSGDGSRDAARLARRVLAGRPDFLIHLGDFAYGGGTAAQYAARFFRPYGRLLARVPLMPTPGNHDLGGRSVYRDLFAPAADGENVGGPHYAFDWGPAHFASVSSPEFVRGAAPGAPWLAADLGAVAPGRWRVVFLHEPPYTAGAKVTVPGLRATLEPLLEAAHVDLVLTGHQHFYERGQPACAYARDAAVLHVVSGGGGANLDAAVAHPNFPRTVSATHYVRVRVTPDAFDLRAIDASGRLLDHVRRRRGDRPPCVAAGWPPAHDR